MILIADSGSTKTSWAIIENEHEVRFFQTSGFNPYTQTAGQISKTIIDEVMPEIKGKVENIYFYGAGCSTLGNRNVMRDAFFHNFKKIWNIEVNHDMLGAARALWFDEKGIAAILGTGSNSCLYKAGEIISAVPSLGFILGDEGSGAYMGKTVVRDYLYNKMPEAVRKTFNERYSLGTSVILDNVYKKENPNRWLSAFALFVSENIHERYCQNIALQSMKDFFEAHLIQYPDFHNIPLGVVGSIGFYFRESLEIVSREYGFNLKKVIKSPIDELVKYHIQHEG